MKTSKPSSKEAVEGVNRFYTRFFKLKIPAYYLVLLLIAMVPFWYKLAANAQTLLLANATKTADHQACKYTFPRLGGFKYVDPLMSADKDCESDRFDGLKSDLENQINSFKSAGKVTAGSVYLRDFKDEGWTEVNGTEEYNPASMLKVLLMIAVLRKSEDTTGYLSVKVHFAGPSTNRSGAAFPPQKQIEPGKTYTVKELLSYMVCYSDNDATQLLIDLAGVKTLEKTHKDLGLAIPQGYTSPVATVGQVSFLLDVLYNVGYLTIHDSEFACSLLAQSDFNNGIVAGLPAGTKIIHKFGEAGSEAQGDAQLHEMSIIYLPTGPIIFSVMTKGKSKKEQAELITALTKTIYNQATN